MVIAKFIYVCLFTCAVSCTIHLETVTGPTVKSFFYTFRPFAGRQSVSRLLPSDSGSTFLAALEELNTLASISGIVRSPHTERN